MFDPGLKIGETLKNSEIVDKFKCGNMGRMRRSKTTNTLVIVSDYTKGIYHDKWIGGVLHYTGNLLLLIFREMLAENLLPEAEEITAVPCFSRIFPACCLGLEPSFADPQEYPCLQLGKAVSRAFRFAKNISRKQHSGSEACRIKQKEAECSISCLRPVIPLLF